MRKEELVKGAAASPFGLRDWSGRGRRHKPQSASRESHQYPGNTSNASKQKA